MHQDVLLRSTAGTEFRLRILQAWNEIVLVLPHLGYEPGPNLLSWEEYQAQSALLVSQIHVTILACPSSC